MNETVALLSRYDAVIVQDRTVDGAFILTFPFEGAKVTIRIALHDYSGADVVITNMTTLPDSAKKHGLGSRAVQSVLAWATENGFTDIRAVQVQKQSELFWVKNRFAKCQEPNPCNDFIYQGESNAKSE